MPFPYDFPFDFDVGIIGMPVASLTWVGPAGTVQTRTLPTAVITRITMIGILNQEGTIAGVVTERQGLSGVVE